MLHSNRDKSADIEWHLVKSVYVPNLSESLVAAVWFAIHRGVITVLDAVPKIYLRSGETVVLDISRGVSRSQNIVFYHPSMAWPSHVIDTAPTPYTTAPTLADPPSLPVTEVHLQ